MKTFFAILFLFFTVFVAWPYYHVWRLDQVVILNDRKELSALVEIKTVREQIRRRLNKEVDSTVGNVSNAFVDWLQDGIQRMGAEAVNRLVTLEWVREQLLSKTGPQDPPGFLDQVSYAFFDSPAGFLVRIGELGEDPVHFRLSLHAGSWRLTALYN